ncbi:MAG: hypothetical protein L0L39_04845, partial [Atopostipes suicloacalis]|nr:hypothetical protein [Atopostipes suicloacalis]
MNKWIKGIIVTLLVSTQFISMPGISAEAKTTNQTEKEKIENKVKETQKKIDKNLSEASEITISLEELSEEMKDQEELIAETEEEIKDQETLVEDRYKH